MIRMVDAGPAGPGGRNLRCNGQSRNPQNQNPKRNRARASFTAFALRAFAFALQPRPMGQRFTLYRLCGERICIPTRHRGPAQHTFKSSNL